MISFIQRLTDEQINYFFIEYFNYPYSHSFYRKENEIHVLAEIIRTDFGQYEYNFVMSDYGCDNSLYLEVWVEYLTEIFGEEYKQAYLEHCEKN